MQGRALKFLVLGGGLALCLVAASILAVTGEARKQAQAPVFRPLRKEHSGQVVRVGDRFLEADLEQGNRVRVFLLGPDEEALEPIPAPQLEGHVQPWNREDQTRRLVLNAAPQPGDPPGSASSFAGEVPAELTQGPMTVGLTVPLKGKAYRVSFNLSKHAEGATHAPEHGGAPINPETAAALKMPGGFAPGEAQQLYQTPGGRYTKADILANGGQTASQAFQGFIPSHDPNPKSGDRICPITGTKANPKIRWTIGGKEYWFCCPPCVDEYVKRAREKPEAIRPPESFVKR